LDAGGAGIEVNTSINAPSVENPFPATAVAVLRPSDTEVLTIPTEAVQQASVFLSDYLQRSRLDSPEESTGSIVAIVGEYGTGKTHIALSLLATLRDQDTVQVHSFYLDAPADTFLALYRDRFIPRLRRRDVRQQVENYLSDVLAAHLRQSKITAPAADTLEAGSTDPIQLMQTVGLIESDVMRDLKQRLRAVTERDDYASALSLFLRPEFEDAVWEWLCGNPPDPALRERGITRAIDSEPAALEAIGVFAFLYGRRGQRFVLLVDEMEKVLTPTSGRDVDQATVLALKKLMEAVGRTRSLLVLIGLPDFLETLPEDTRQRISAKITPGPMTVAEITQYIREVQKNRLGHAQLKPFNRDSVAYIEEITGGNARRVVRLCYLAYQAASVGGTQITRATLRDVARDQFESAPQHNAAHEVARIFDSTGWSYEQDVSLNADKMATVDFWLPLADGQVGMIVVLSRSLLYSAEVEETVARVAAWKSNRSGLVLSILVLNGYMAENFSSTVSRAFDRVLYLGSRDFREDFEAVARGYRDRLESSTRKDTLEHVAERVDQLGRQLDFIIDEFERSRRSAVQTNDIETSVAMGIRRFFAEIGSEISAARAPGFEAAYRVLDEAHEAVAMVRNRAVTARSDFPPKALYVLDDMYKAVENFRAELTAALRHLSNLSNRDAGMTDVERLCQRVEEKFVRLVGDLQAYTSTSDPAYSEIVRRLRILTDLGYKVLVEVREASQSSE
jgi:type II secretory pathway predicted ATPase ExeA